MKVLVNILAAIVLIVTIIAGEIYWNHQTSAEASNTTGKESSLTNRGSKAASGN